MNYLLEIVYHEVLEPDLHHVFLASVDEILKLFQHGLVVCLDQVFEDLKEVGSIETGTVSSYLTIPAISLP